MSADLHGIVIAPEIGWGGGVQFVDLFLRRAVGRRRQGGPSAHPLTGCVMLAVGLLITPSKILILHGNGSKERRAGVGQRRTDGIAVFPVSAARSLLVRCRRQDFPPQLFSGRPGDESAVDDEFRTGDEARFVGREE